MYTGKSIDGGSIEVYAKSENITDLLRRSPISPIKAGTKFEFPLSEVPKDILEVNCFYILSLYIYESNMFDCDSLYNPKNIIMVTYI